MKLIFMAHPAIYFSTCHRRICCHGNYIIDRRFSDILHSQLLSIISFNLKVKLAF